MSAISFLLTTFLTISAHAGPLCATLSWHHWNQDNGGGKYYITPDCWQTTCWEERDLEHSHWDNNASGFKVEKYCMLEMWCGGTHKLKAYDSFDFMMKNKNNPYVYDHAWHGPMISNLGGSWNDCLSAFRCTCNFPSLDAIPADFHGGRRRAEEAAEEATGGFVYAWDQTEVEGLRTFENSVKTPPKDNEVLARLLDGETDDMETEDVETEEVAPSPQDASDQKQPQGELSEDASASATAPKEGGEDVTEASVE